MRYLLLLLLAIFLLDIASAQSVYLSKIDINSGALTRMNKLPGVSGVQSLPRYIHFNTSRTAYVFAGIDPSGNKRLYTIDVQNGSIAAAPLFPGSKGQEEIVSELAAYTEHDSIFAMCLNTKTGGHHLVLIDPITGVYRYLAELSDIKSVLFNTGNYDVTTNRYSFAAIHNNGNPEYISINADSLSITRIPLLPGNYTNLKYDAGLDSVFMLNYNTVGKILLQSLNRQTGSVRKISTITPVKAIDSSEHIVSYDDWRHSFIFCGYNAAQQKRIYLVDALSGAINSDVPYPVLKHNQDKLFQLLPDPETGTVYCLYWTSDLEQVLADSIQLGPNPFHTVLNVDLGRTVSLITYILHDVSGRKIKTAEIQQARSFGLNREGLYAGIYLLSVFVENRLLGTWPVVAD